MTNQAAMQKVRRAIIDPMARYWNLKAMDDYQVEAFVEDLGDYSEEALASAFVEVRRSCKGAPRVAHFIEALKGVSRTPLVPSSPQSRGEYWCRHDRRLAASVMRSPIGQLALQRGVGLSLWMLAYRDGKDAFTEADIEREARCLQDSVDRMAILLTKPSPYSESIRSMWEAMWERERRLNARFAASQ